MGKESMVKIRLVRSLIGVPEKQRRVVRALGLGKRNSSVLLKDNPAVNGMIFKVKHLLAVERVGK